MIKIGIEVELPRLSQPMLNENYIEIYKMKGPTKTFYLLNVLWQYLFANCPPQTLPQQVYYENLLIEL